MNVRALLALGFNFGVLCLSLSLSLSLVRTVQSTNQPYSEFFYFSPFPSLPFLLFFFFFFFFLATINRLWSLVLWMI